MRSNLELKARYHDLSDARTICESIDAQFEGLLCQVDTYFNVPTGRLKLREINSERAELIAYDRPDHIEARLSDYILSNITDPAGVKAVLTRSLGVKVVVKKRRDLMLWRNVRIHLDHVDGLGSFIEFEAVIKEERDKMLSPQRLIDLCTALRIRDEDRIAHSYSDLMLSHTGGPVC